MDTTDLECSADKPLFYCSAGDDEGRPLILLHGWGADHRYFDYQLKTFKDYRLIIPDLEGFGSSFSEDVPKRFTISDQAEKVLTLARSLGVESTVVIGHSQGGMIAQELSLSHPDFVKGLVLEDTTPGIRHVSFSNTLSRFYPLLYISPRPLMIALARRWAIYCKDASEAAIGMIEEYARVNCRKVLAKYVKAMREWSSLDRLDQVSIPTLCMYGIKDRLLSSKHSDLLASRLATSKTVSIPNSGHTPHLESPRYSTERFYPSFNPLNGDRKFSAVCMRFDPILEP